MTTAEVHYRKLRVVLTGDLDERLISEIRVASEVERDYFWGTEPRGPLEAEWVVRRYMKQETGRSTLVLTSHDLYHRDVGWLFGFSDMARGVAVVSTFRLGNGATLEQLRLRVGNVIAHELAHLGGWKHCKKVDCLMHPVSSLEEIDQRNWAPCGDCGRRGWGRKVAVAAGAAVACLALFIGLDHLGGRLKPSMAPFSCGSVPAYGRQLLLYQDHALLNDCATGSRSPLFCCLPAAADVLNGLFKELNPGQLEVVRRDEKSAVIRYGGVDLLEVPGGVSAGEDPTVAARMWANDLGSLLRGKGTDSEGCPSCHIGRAKEVELWARRRRGM